ncbi:hypothetical protein ACFQ36_03540 [Arthrobacter sp. GCM10027362]|uniref:hypothetical protein n=1 Tax=Arthrobacter sp. GCM10027362 TaxID=3273379 RepID=UPI00362E0898
MAGWWKGGRRPTPAQLNRIGEVYGYWRESEQAAAEAEAAERRQLFDRLAAARRERTARSGRVPAEQLAQELTAHLAGAAEAIRVRLPWIDRLPPADQAWLIGRIVLAADAGDTAALVEAITSWQDAPAEPAPLNGDRPGEQDQPPGPEEAGGLPRLTATGLSARIRSELGGRGPGQDDLDAFCRGLLEAFTPDAAWLWLQGHNPRLGGRPIDVLAVAGTEPVRDAIRAYIQGAFD